MLIGTWWRYPAVSLSVIAVLWAVVCVGAAIQDHDSAQLADLWFSVALGLLIARFYMTRKVEFDTRSVTVHNFWRTRTYAWSEVDDVAVVTKGKVYSAPTLRLKGGKGCRIFAGLRRTFTADKALAVESWVVAMDQARGVHRVLPPRPPTLAELTAQKTAAVAPKPEKPSARWWRLAFAVPVIVLGLWAFAIFVRNEVNDISLAHGGVVFQARVLGHDHVDNGDGSGSDRLWIAVPACHCAVEVPTDNPDAHPKDSTIPARYDQSDPANVQSLVDVPTQWPQDLFGGGGFAVFFVLPAAIIVWVDLLRKRPHNEASRVSARAAADAEERGSAPGPGSILSSGPSTM